jgi:putative ABC transport system permease protein
VASSALFGIPTLYTTYTRAQQYLPNPRFTISYILVEPKSAADIPEIERQVHASGYLALTRNEFIDRVSKFYMYQTGVGINLLIMTLTSFVIGLSISGQTFYSFVIENLEKFGALKAIGAKGRELVLMILFQAALVAATGYGAGIGLYSLTLWLARLYLPDYAAVVTWLNLVLAFVMVVVISIVSSYFGVRKVLKIEPFEIFRG